MKKILLFVAAAATLLFQSCNSCNGNKKNEVVTEFESDSLYWVNDSTIADKQTFIFEGTAPMNNNAVADVLLTISTISLNSDGTYSITTDYVDEGLATQTDNGEAVILLGTGNDSTMTVIDLVSANNYPTVSFMMLEDSSLVRVDNKGKPVSKHPEHRLKVKK